MKPQGAVRLNVFYAQWKHRHFFIISASTFATDELGAVGVGRQNQQHQPAFRDGSNNGILKDRARGNVAWCVPALYVFRLQCLTDNISSLPIFFGVTDEYFVSHLRSFLT
jgi:hypothetical protein